MCKLELKGIEYSYDNKKKILRDINILFEPGKIYSIVGPSGCGKTTLLSLIGGLDTPSSGEITIDGVNINVKGLANHRKNNISFIFQSYNLIDYMTPLENVKLTAKEDPKEALVKVGLNGEEMKRNVLKLSGGQQQRVAIARALAANTPIILADEPTGNLDEETALEIIDLLKESAHIHKKCVIVVTHSLALARQTDEILKLRRGILSKKN